MSTKGAIKKKFHRFFAVNEQLRRFAKRLIDTQPQVNTPKDGIACFMLAKAYKTHGVVTHLAKNGFVEDADMLVRTMFDVALIISACLDDRTDATSWKYLHFDDSLRAKMYLQLRDQGQFKEIFEERKNNPKANQESIDAILARATKWLDEYGGDFKQKWHSGQSTGQLAEAVNLKPYFHTAFNLQSQLMHSLPRCMNFYLKDTGEQIIMDVEPHEYGAEMSIVAAFNMLIVVADKFNNHFTVFPESEIGYLVGKWQEVVKALEQ